ncbi:dihydropyrimidinase [Intestinimonas butyriciproducens]|uniref:dihydropyrimidinase n=1 Tax=Intestinimonas butyriciproducens TaxID=1297617 RepID=UPI001C0F9911|nr:dihydropyrimidinase [Intestinimonas butyriciproducens]MBU5228957.1 dihydropyrimidinase [Intestinimonas butyriciproducens]MCI6363359.1 dihydropyrimidinase [Intestinimonas butyriciproducens]MDB7861312.1 dihydropyrimidinase [Intestinimonas butyriciproducens]MDB7864164.1 dihydropyrimidinase [Intestinimonas butyriciproducens]MDY3616682.1 dihydropyrimidinase [Intestinimonas butyriciproducens]
MSILIQNGILVLPTGPIQADLRVAGGRIAELGPGLAPGASRVIDAQERLVFPGFIDTHTHFEMNKGFPNETADDWYTGTRAALAGGTTTVLDFAEPERGATLASALETWHGRADGAACCNYGFHMTVKDWSPSIRSELREMTAAGVTSYKVYLAYDNLRLSDAAAYEVVKAVGAEGGVVGCHCENGDLVTEGIRAQQAAGNLSPAAHPLSRPPAVEAEAVGRWLTIAELAGCPVNIVHLSTLRGLEAVRAARTRGQRLYVETCPQYLLLDERSYRLPGFESAKFVLSPPLRAQENCAALWDALEAGEIDTIGTDHCSFRFHGAKELGREDFSKIPNGIPGVEHRPSLMYTYGVAAGRITAVDMARLLAENPARLFGMYPQKGVLAVGSDADLVIFDPNDTGRITAETQYQNVDYTPYEGMELRGRVDTVLLGGEVAVEGGRVLLERRGRYVSRGPSGFWR